MWDQTILVSFLYSVLVESIVLFQNGSNMHDFANILNFGIGNEEGGIDSRYIQEIKGLGDFLNKGSECFCIKIQKGADLGGIIISFDMPSYITWCTVV